MKRLSFVSLCAVAFVAALLCAKHHSAFAQRSPTKEWRQIQVHNMRPDMLTYLLDPEHQKTPPEFQMQFGLFNGHYSQKGGSNTFPQDSSGLSFGGDLYSKSFRGVSSIVSIALSSCCCVTLTKDIPFGENLRSLPFEFSFKRPRSQLNSRMNKMTAAP